MWKPSRIRFAFTAPRCTNPECLFPSAVPASSLSRYWWGLFSQLTKNQLIVSNEKSNYKHLISSLIRSLNNGIRRLTKLHFYNLYLSMGCSSGMRSDEVLCMRSSYLPLCGTWWWWLIITVTTKLEVCVDRWYRNILLQEETQIFHPVLTNWRCWIVAKEIEYDPYEIQGKIKTLKNSLQRMRKHLSSS